MTRAALLPLVALVSLACGSRDALPPGSPVSDPGRVSVDASVTSGPEPTTTPVPDGTLGAEPDGTTGPEESAPEVESTTAEVAVTPGCSPISVATGPTPVIGERCDPDASFAGPRPAALVLTGCGGYAADDELGSAMATALAREGIVAVRVDYLGASSLASCDPVAVGDAAEPLLRAVADTVALLRLDPAVDAGSIGAVGYSLGALTALSAALGGPGLVAVDPVPLAALSLLSVPNWVPEIADELSAGVGPALFVMSGEADDTTPPADSEALVAAALDGGLPVELVLVPGQGHLWNGPMVTVVSSVLAKELAERIAG